MSHLYRLVLQLLERYRLDTFMILSVFYALCFFAALTYIPQHEDWEGSEDNAPPGGGNKPAATAAALFDVFSVSEFLAANPRLKAISTDSSSSDGDTSKHEKDTTCCSRVKTTCCPRVKTTCCPRVKIPCCPRVSSVKSTCSRVKDTCKTLFTVDKRIWKNRNYLIWLAAIILSHFTMYVPIVHLVS